MRKILSFLSFICAFNGIAFGQESQWKLVKNQENKIADPVKIADFLASHSTPEFEALRAQATSRILAGLPVDRVVAVSETVTTLKWIGPTKCTANDPRLTVEASGFSFDFESGHGTGSGSSPVEADPCAN